MSDAIGRIAVPTVINSGQTFPLTTQYPFGFSVERAVIVHRFGSLDAKQEQRYYAGIGPRKFQFKRPNLNWTESRQLKAFWESMQGPWQAFTYNIPNPDGTTSAVLVTFEQTPISFEYLRNAVQVGLNLVEVVDPTEAPTYAINSICVRFPSIALSAALLSEVQQIVPLVHIRVRESAVSDVYLSDRRVTVGGQLYLPRLMSIGETGSDVLISQDIKGASDNVRFTFGNADRVMTQLANDTDLKYAQIDLCLFHVNSGILLQLWKGVIQNYVSDGTPVFPLTCSDGFFQIMNQYPERQINLWQGLKLDGNLNVTKYQPGMGLRYIPGSDPANPATDYFSLGQGTPQVWEPNVYAAGTAACEIRIVKSTTIQPSTPDQHQMKVPIDYGMWGWMWDQNGNRTSVRGLINPFWIAVNMLLRAMGLYGDPSTGSTPAGGSGPASADQLAVFVLPSLMAGDGSGSAEIAAAQVPAILGAGNETQFQFQGVISSQKPFRDWLTEVLNCCLGFYAWEFGKLKLGCRINASAVDAYTAANMLFQSLKLTPIQAAFEHLVISFADVAYQYQANTAEYCDKSHAAYYGRAGSPLTSQMHSVGCSTLSQALRIAATRTREEIGGVNPTEWRNARCASWGTTLLGLGNEVGQVVSITHPDMPSGTGKFRIQRWSLKKDWSLQIEAQTVTDSMYDLDVGPKPMDVVPAPLPGLYYPIPLGPAWAPYQVQAAAWDALFPNEWTFDSNQTYTTLADGSALASLIVTGKLPVNEFSATGAGAPGIEAISQSATGGSLPANATLRVAVCAIDSSGLPSAPSNIAIIGTGTAAGGSLTLENITWPAVAGLVSYVLFVATQDDLICAQATGALTAGPNSTYTPGSITFGGPVARSTWALPSPYVSRIRVKAKRVVHSGVIRQFYVGSTRAREKLYICGRESALAVSL